MKKILAIAVALIMVMALSVTAFANIDLSANASDTYDGTSTPIMIEIPAEVDVSDGAVVTLHLKGTSGNPTIRAYLTDGGDVGRVTDVSYFEVTDGAFDATQDLVIDYNGGFGGTVAPTVICIKAEAAGANFVATNFEVVEVVTAGGEAAAVTPAVETNDAPAAAVAAKEEVIYDWTSPFGIATGWTTIFDKGSEDALALLAALNTEGATFKMVGTDLTEADKGEGDVWFQLAVQDMTNWDDVVCTENVGETFEFTDEGYVITAPAKAVYDAFTADNKEEDLGFIFNSSSEGWAKAATKLHITVTATASAAPAPSTSTATTPAPSTSTSTSTSTAPNTGLALAVVPAVMALAAVAVSKKR